MLTFIGIANTTRKDLLLALDSSFNDFEDGVEYYTAKSFGNIDHIITRNHKDFKNSSITVVSASEYLAS